jgi:hypothetical protein
MSRAPREEISEFSHVPFGDAGDGHIAEHSNERVQVEPVMVALLALRLDPIDPALIHFRHERRIGDEIEKRRTLEGSDWFAVAPLADIAQSFDFAAEEVQREPVAVWMAQRGSRCSRHSAP